MSKAARKPEPDEGDPLEQCKELFQQAVEREADNREAALDDLRFVRLREQWPEAIKRQRDLDGRPCLTVDKLGAFLHQVVNDARQNRPAITCHPVGTGADQETAEVLNGVIRNIEVISDADTAYDTAVEFAVGSGLGYLKVNTRYCSDDSFEQDVVIERVPDPARIYGDPVSLAADSGDWNNAWELEALTPKEFKKAYPDADPVDWEAGAYVGLKEPWREGDRVVVVNWWNREEVPRMIVGLSNGETVGMDVYEERKAEFEEAQVTIVGEPREVPSHKVTLRILTGAEVLKTIEWKGRLIPIVPVYGDDVVVEGRRYLSSLIRGSKDPQRMYNYARSSETESVALAPKTPFIGPKGAFATDVVKWETANNENHAYIEYDGTQPPQRQPYAGPPAGWMTLASSADADIKSQLGMFDASQGKAAVNEQSGKAILALQRQSDTATFHFTDNLSRAIRCLGRVVLDLIPHVYSGERTLRILGADRKPQMVQIGQQPEMQPQQPIDPISGRPIDLPRIYDLTVGKYDLTVAAGPSFGTRREEAASQMLEVIKAYPDAAPVIAPELAKNLDWSGSEKLADDLAAVAQAKAQQAQQGGQQNDAQADMQAAQAKAQIDHAIAMQKAQTDAQLAQQKMQMQAQLDREKAGHDAQLQQDRMQADIAIQTRKAELEADLQRQRFALEASMSLRPDPVIPGGMVG